MCSLADRLECSENIPDLAAVFLTEGNSSLDGKAASNFKKRMASCFSAHPGMCRSKDSELKADVDAFFSQFCQFLSTAGVGKNHVGYTLLQFRSLSGPDPILLMYFLGFMLLRPRRRVMVLCDFVSDGAPQTFPGKATVHVNEAGEFEHVLTHALLLDMLGRKHDAWQVATVEFEDESLRQVAALGILHEVIWATWRPRASSPHDRLKFKVLSNGSPCWKGSRNKFKR